MKISVIMPSYLGEYEGCAPNRQETFIRAVESFNSQKHKDRELIIVSDGCEDTNRITKEKWTPELMMGRIKLIELARHDLFTGEVRQAGIEAATGDILLSLDTDDWMMPHHLTSIACSYDRYLQWAYNDYYIQPYNLPQVNTLYRCDGTLRTLNNGTVSWRKDLGVSYVGADGRLDNKEFCSRLLKFDLYKKIYGTGMVVTNVIIKNVQTS